MYTRGGGGGVNLNHISRMIGLDWLPPLVDPRQQSTCTQSHTHFQKQECTQYKAVTHLLSLSYSCTLRAAVVFSCRRFGVTVTTTGSTGEFECEFEFGLESVNTTGTFTSVYGVMCGVRFVPRRSELPRCESKSRTLCCGCGVWCRVWCIGRAARTTSSQNVAAA